MHSPVNSISIFDLSTIRAGFLPLPVLCAAPLAEVDGPKTPSKKLDLIFYTHAVLQSIVYLESTSKAEDAIICFFLWKTLKCQKDSLRLLRDQIISPTKR